MRIKSLNWREVHSRLIFGTGHIPFIGYVLDGEHVGANWVLMYGDRVRGDYIGKYDTIELGQAAAQTHYESIVRLAIEDE